MENNLEFLLYRIGAMQTHIEKLEKIIQELNGQFLVDRNIDIKRLSE